MCKTTSFGRANVLVLSWSLGGLGCSIYTEDTRNYAIHLTLTSSNGTTTKDSVAPAEKPVNIDSGWVILESPLMLRYVLPQKSFAALARSLNQHVFGDRTMSTTEHKQFDGTFGCFQK